MVYAPLGQPPQQKPRRLNVGCPGCFVPIDEACGALPCTRYSALTSKEPRQIRTSEEPEARASCHCNCCSWRRCCCCVCPTICGLLLLAAVVLLAWLIPGLYPLCWGYLWCQSFGKREGCGRAFDVGLANTPIGENGVPLGYITAALQLFSSSTSEIRMTTVSNWTEVQSLGSQLPSKTWEGDWWRGNELGYIVNNPVFWSKIGIYPATMGPGTTTSQHAAIRPLLKELFVLTTEDQTWLTAFLKEFLEERKAANGKLRIPEDLDIWAHQVLHRVLFGKVVSLQEASAFVALRQKLTSTSTVSQALPGELYGLLGDGSLASEVASQVALYEKLLEPRIGAKLDGADCSPTPRCSLQLASAVFDALALAGGLSVPTAVHSGLGLLYSQHSSNPQPGFVIPAGMEPEFFWEVVRYFPPVWGMPYWTVRPTCSGLTAAETAELSEAGGLTEACPERPKKPSTGAPPVNQWQGGTRVVLQLGRAQYDEKRWGPTASQFEVRSLDVYEKNSVGFAEMAVDASVADGRNDRACPGRALALAMGSIFFEVFQRSDWVASGAADIVLAPFDGWVQATSFELFPSTAVQ